MPPEKLEKSAPDKSAHVAQQVMHRIGENALVPKPEVFAVLYAYYNGDNPDIMHDIGRMDREKKPLTTTICEKFTILTCPINPSAPLSRKPAARCRKWPPRFQRWYAKRVLRKANTARHC
jgi:hypothetical protein